MTTQSAAQLMNEYSDSQDRLIVDFLAGKLDNQKDDVEAVLGDVLYSECCRHRVSVSLMRYAVWDKDSVASQKPSAGPSSVEQEDKSPSASTGVRLSYALVDESVSNNEDTVVLLPGTKVYESPYLAQVGISLNNLSGYSVYVMDMYMMVKTHETGGWERHTSKEYYARRDSRTLRPDQVLKFRTHRIDRKTLVHEVERLMVYYGGRTTDVSYRFFLKVFDALKNGCRYEVGKLDPSSYCCTISIRVETGVGPRPIWSHFNIEPPLIHSTF